MIEKTIVNSLIKLIFLFSSFTVWFAINSYLRWNIFLIMLLCSVNVILYSALPKLTLPKESYIENVLLVLLIVIITISFGYNTIVNPHPKLLSNYIGMLIIIAVFYFYYTAAIFTYAQKNLIIRWCAYGGVIVMLIASVDGFLVNFFDIRIHDWFVFGFPGNTTYFDRAIWSSPCSPCVEPAETALFINTLFPFCLYFFKGVKKYILIGLYVFCIFELFSSVGVFTMITGAVIYVFLTQSKIRMITLFIFLSIVVSILFIKYYQSISDYSQYLAIIDKLTLSGNTASDSDRTAAWSTAIADGFRSPLLGNGSGYGKVTRENGYLSVFLLMLGDYGIIAFLIFVSFWALLCYKVIMIKDKIRPYLLLSFFSVSIGAAVGDISNSFVLWFLIPIIYKFYKEGQSANLRLKLNCMQKNLLMRGERLLVIRRKHL